MNISMVAGKWMLANVLNFVDDGFSCNLAEIDWYRMAELARQGQFVVVDVSFNEDHLGQLSRGQSNHGVVIDDHEVPISQFAVQEADLRAYCL